MIFFFSNMQHEAVWKCIWIRVGNAADMVKLTHYKWICNPRVDLNSVYCQSQCLCVRVYACVLRWVCLHSCICFFSPVTKSFVHLTFFVNTSIVILQSSIWKQRYFKYCKGILTISFVVCFRKMYYTSEVLQKHIRTCVTHTITGCFCCALGRISCFGTEGYGHQSINRSLPTPGRVMSLKLYGSARCGES